MNTEKIITNLIKLLEEAPRSGTDEDVPEGSRFIILSDTLAKEIVENLKGLTLNSNVNYTAEHENQ